MSEKSASVLWSGAGRQGLGKISTETGALMDDPYGSASRIGDDRRGTNPEETLGAARAACFMMAFSFACDQAGFATAQDFLSAATCPADVARPGRGVLERTLGNGGQRRSRRPVAHLPALVAPPARAASRWAPSTP